MKLAFVYDAVYPWEQGGVQKRVWEVARRLVGDHEVHLYGMQYWDGPATIEREGVLLHGVCDRTDLYADGRRSISQALRFAAAVAPPLVATEFDVIDCQEFPYFSCFAAKLPDVLGRAELVTTWHEVWGEYWYDYLGPSGVFGKGVERLATRLSDRIVAVSQQVVDDLAAVGRTEGIDLVPNGVDVAAIDAVEPATDDWDVAYVGRLAEHKNVDVLLDAVHRASRSLDRSLTCAIVGDGPERDALEQRADALGIASQCSFLGTLDRARDVYAVMKAADTFVSPSVREGFGMTVLEASACGVPSIVADHPDNAATALVADGRTGYVADPSAAAIADRIERLRNDDQRRRAMGDAAAERASKHDWDRISDRLETVYARALTS